MGRGSTEQAAQAAPRRFKPQIRAMLWGGQVGCKPVLVGELTDEIRAYQNGGPAFAAESGSELPAGAAFLGRFRLVDSRGPDTPVYVALD